MFVLRRQVYCVRCLATPFCWRGNEVPHSKTGIEGIGHVVANRPPFAIRSTHYTQREQEGWEAHKQEQPALILYQSFLISVINGLSVSCTSLTTERCS